MESRVTAILGPTNTGKTHLAVETMLDHESGIIGFPLINAIGLFGNLFEAIRTGITISVFI